MSLKLDLYADAIAVRGLPEHIRLSDARSDTVHVTYIPRLLHLRIERVAFR